MGIIEDIIKEGVLVEPKLAERISLMRGEEQAELMERIRIEKPLILSEEFFENIIEVTEVCPQKKISVQESAAELNLYFNALQNLFEKKNRAVSIANASENASVIGLVRSVLPDGFEIEDQTGAIKVVSKTQVDEDDVVMVAGKAMQKVLYADLVEFPDAPERQMKKSPKKCEIVFGCPAEGADYSICFGEKMSIGKNSLVVGKNPALVRINNITIMVHNQNSGKNISPLHVLKKRRLPGTLVPIAEVPDILLLRGAENVLENYKGATAIAANDKSVARINLRTREAKFEQ
ncbi:MAG: hypothetical protein WA139_00025 [Candidatus Aenigmatarchaeota archaeon]